jgi:hypothetical protein
MGEITTICLFLVGGLCISLARIVRRRQRIETRTREWVEYLQQDLSASSL